MWRRSRAQHRCGEACGARRQALAARLLSFLEVHAHSFSTSTHSRWLQSFHSTARAASKGCGVNERQHQASGGRKAGEQGGTARKQKKKNAAALSARRCTLFAVAAARRRRRLLRLLLLLLLLRLLLLLLLRRQLHGNNAGVDDVLGGAAHAARVLGHILPELLEDLVCGSGGRGVGRE